MVQYSEKGKLQKYKKCEVNVAKPVGIKTSDVTSVSQFKKKKQTYLIKGVKTQVKNFMTDWSLL